MPILQKKFLLICITIFLTLIITAMHLALPHTTQTQLLALPAPHTNVLLIPLDSRPVCSSLPQKLGHLAGLNVILPPKGYLDNYKTPADKQKLLQWLQFNSQTYAYNIISADMLLHGSLLEARKNIATRNDENILLHNLETIFNEQKASPEQYTIFSIIPRLLVSDELLPDRWYQYQLLRYSQLADMVRISGSFALTQKMRETEAKIPPKVLNKYINQYQQSDRFNINLLNLTQKQNNLKLIIGQDDASPLGLPHVSAERVAAFINSKNLASKAQLTYGADEIAALLITRTYLQQSKWQPKIFIRYANEKTAFQHMPYMAVAAKTALSNQLALLGAQQTNSMQQADIICYVNCGSDTNSPGKQQAQEVQQLLEAGYKVAVIDSSKDYEPHQLLLPQLLKHNVLLNKLIAYAGWNTFSNSSGTALAQAVIFAGRLRQMQAAHAEDEQIASLYAENLNFTLARILEDYYYQKNIHPILRQELSASGIDPTNLKKEEKFSAEQKIQAQLALNAFTILHSNLGRTPFYKHGDKEYYLSSLTVSSKLPWNRIFEVELNIWTKVGEK